MVVAFESTKTVALLCLFACGLPLSAIAQQTAPVASAEPVQASSPPDAAGPSADIVVPPIKRVRPTLAKLDPRLAEKPMQNSKATLRSAALTVAAKPLAKPSTKSSLGAAAIAVPQRNSTSTKAAAKAVNTKSGGPVVAR